MAAHNVMDQNTSQKKHVKTCEKHEETPQKCLLQKSN